jgi:hypothetical protein
MGVWMCHPILMTLIGYILSEIHRKKPRVYPNGRHTTDLTSVDKQSSKQIFTTAFSYFMKLVTNIMPIKTTQIMYYLISYH